jgi:hypothetical protein
MLPVVPLWVHLATTAAVALAAVWRGGREERFIALFNLVSSGLNVVVGAPFHYNLAFKLLWATPDVVLFTCIALRSSRGWTLVAASIAWVSLATVAVQVYAQVDRWAFATTQLVWHYLMMAIVLFGVCTAPRRNARPGRRFSRRGGPPPERSYEPWLAGRRSSSRSPPPC